MSGRASVARTGVLGEYVPNGRKLRQGLREPRQLSIGEELFGVLRTLVEATSREGRE